LSPKPQQVILSIKRL